ncbi:hypothetical protein BG004_001528, partial [Podila humilis]
MMIFRKSLLSAAVAILALSCTAVTASPIAHPDAIASSTLSGLEKREIVGYNDWSCKPSAQYAYPIVMIHGLGASDIEWVYMGPRFAAKGYCVFTLNYGAIPGIPVLLGLDDMRNGANQLEAFVDKVLNATGASKVDIVGHSEGSVLPRVYFKYNNGGPKTRKLAGFGSNQYGTEKNALVKFLESLGLSDVVQLVLNAVCKSCLQLFEGSEFLQQLNSPNDTVPDV